MRRVLIGAGLFLAIAALGAAQWVVPPLRARVRVGQGYVAKQVCSCMFVAGRNLAGCRADIPAAMDPIQAEPSGDGVRAFLTLFGERRARYSPERGCTLEGE